MILSEKKTVPVSSILTTASSAFEALATIENLPLDTVILIDIDDTIITPVSRTFRAPPFNRMIDEIKENGKSYENYESIITSWRLQRKVMLLDDHWPEVLELIKKNYMVFGLTKMNSGACGHIPSLEQWRYTELEKLGITFSQEPAFAAFNSIVENNGNESVYYKGLFLTGSATKAKTLRKYLAPTSCTSVVMIDDRSEHIEDIRLFCEENSLNYTGILFEGLQNLSDKPDAEIARFQKEYLITHAQWLEDEDALRLMDSRF